MEELRFKSRCVCIQSPLDIGLCCCLWGTEDSQRQVRGSLTWQCGSCLGSQSQCPPWCLGCTTSYLGRFLTSGLLSSGVTDVWNRVRGSKWGVGTQSKDKFPSLRIKYHEDVGVGRYALLPHTTKGKITTNLKSKNNQNCQEIELYGSPTTKEIKKKHSSSQVGGVETENLGREDTQQGSDWQTRRSHICMWINRVGQLGSETDCTTQSSSVGK